jgi:hypothetical protein
MLVVSIVSRTLVRHRGPSLATRTSHVSMGLIPVDQDVAENPMTTTFALSGPNHSC